MNQIPQDIDRIVRNTFKVTGFEHEPSLFGRIPQCFFSFPCASLPNRRSFSSPQQISGDWSYLSAPIVEKFKC
jgi:hypothetical protein